MPSASTGIHVNLLAVRRDVSAPADPTAEEKAYLAQLQHCLREETGYQWIQGTKPQTLAYGLTDSPAGLAAWIVEKFRTWSDCGGDVERRFSKDALLTNVDALLGHRGHQLVVLAVLREVPRALAHSRRPPHRGAHRVRRLPARDPQPAPRVGRARLQHPALDGDAAPAVISPPWKSPTLSPRTSARSSAP